MKIQDAIRLTKGLSLICTDKDKDYKFLSSIEYGSLTSFDYVYIPLIENNENVFDEIEKHLKNKSCKGFYLNKAVLQRAENQIHFHNILKTYASKIEVVVLARNTFNSGFEIGEENMKTFRPKVVTIAGTEEKSLVSSLVKYCLSSKGKTVASIKGAKPWQKLIEPMLNIDDKTQYCVVELLADKTDVYKYARNSFVNNTIIYLKTSLNFLNKYEDDKDKFIDEIASVADNPDNVLNIFTFEENDFVNSSLKTNKINIIEERKIETNILPSSIFTKRHLNIKYKNISLDTDNYAYYIPRCLVITYYALKSLGLDEKYIKKCFKDFKDTSGIYEETKFSLNNYLVMSNEDHTSHSIQNTLKQFCFEYKDFKKIVVLSRIENLGSYSDSVHKDLLKDLANESLDTLVFINMNDYEADYKVYNKKTFVKRFKINNNTDHRNTILNMKMFLESRVDENTAILVCVPSNMNLNALFNTGGDKQDAL